MEMADHEVGVGDVPVEGNRGKHDSGQTADDEQTRRNRVRRASGVFMITRPPQIVPIQLKILIPVGTAMRNVLAAKNAFSDGGRPTANMWCAQTPIDWKAIQTSAITIIVYPKITLRLKTGMISEMKPKAGMIRM